MDGFRYTPIMTWVTITRHGSILLPHFGKLPKRLDLFCNTKVTYSSMNMLPGIA